MLTATVVVSCYNQKHYIDEALQSVLGQQTNFDFNILISDDCSTDGTREIITDYQSLYPEKITAISRRQNIGAGRNYIEAHKMATGDIIFHLDGDDVMLPGKLQKQFDVFQEETVNLVFHRALYFSDDASYQAETGNPNQDREGIKYFEASDLATWGTVAVHSSYAYRRSARKVMDPKREFMEWFFAMDALIPTGKGAYLNEILVKYRCNPTGGAYLASKAGRYKAYNIYFDDLLHYFKAQPALRKELYANGLVTTLAMLKNGSGYAKGVPFFLLTNLLNFRMSNFKESIKMRAAVAPSKRIR
ncbi:glycosyltransferase [Legionella lansingensis]|uniref:Glycosyltransferase n=1 Tax=Legionella lansingensis TaxID=45067 RepID=A0A0W0VWK7_9GAMM|nr:glycosyltransferase [Legionella lansingensis]KTD24354.1 glycosyltransferase [Legionella lansingensis]SNV51696.1 glycosyltransferase [Legionella lansingensis]